MRQNRLRWKQRQFSHCFEDRNRLLFLSLQLCAILQSFVQLVKLRLALVCIKCVVPFRISVVSIPTCVFQIPNQTFRSPVFCLFPNVFNFPFFMCFFFSLLFFLFFPMFSFSPFLKTCLILDSGLLWEIGVWIPQWGEQSTPTGVTKQKVGKTSKNMKKKWKNKPNENEQMEMTGSKNATTNNGSRRRKNIKQ